MINHMIFNTGNATGAVTAFTTLTRFAKRETSMINVPRLRHGNGLHESGNQIEIKINEIILQK